MRQPRVRGATCRSRQAAAGTSTGRQRVGRRWSRAAREKGLRKGRSSGEEDPGRGPGAPRRLFPGSAFAASYLRPHPEIKLRAGEAGAAQTCKRGLSSSFPAPPGGRWAGLPRPLESSGGFPLGSAGPPARAEGTRLRREPTSLRVCARRSRPGWRGWASSRERPARAAEAGPAAALGRSEAVRGSAEPTAPCPRAPRGEPAASPRT
ncbi:unnamed protein product [Rangifer tarandus platyrhynchus]|uniref:Uncharacterized protein n=2 Tax=Rangifer tarandus platyrhynchus TaxID=3082113 RepID=A0ABN8ZV24_RANTA|nr:unnamed protein product [Rangifer tarandus platyrhynchus]CAI9710685.1 unnamed protein product [Rangifer tarandus platyrhynchus]